MHALPGIATALAFVLPAVGGPSPNVWQLLLAWACILVLLASCGPSRVDARLVVLLLVTGGLLAWGGGQSPLLTAPAVASILAIGLAAAAGAGLVQGPSGRLRGWAIGLAVGGLVSAVMGLLQYFGAEQALGAWMHASEPGVAVGNLRQRNQFATFESAALVAVIWCSLGREEVDRRARRATWWALEGAMVVALAASTSRTGLLQLLGILFVCAVAAWRARGTPAAGQRPGLGEVAGLLLLYAVASLLLPVLAGHGLPGLFSRMSEGVDAHSRLVLWHNVIDLIAQRPWTGWGWGELKFAQYQTDFDGPRFSEILDNAHDLPLHLAVELGLPAALVICGGGLLVLASERPWRERDATRLLAWVLVAVVLMHSLLEYPLWYGPFQLLVGVALGMLFSRPATATATGLPRRLSAGRFLGAALLAMGIGITAVSYSRISQLFLPREARWSGLRDDTLAQLSDSWLFQRDWLFASLSLTPLTAANVGEQLAWTDALLHYSPEPRVLARRIEALRLLGQAARAREEERRFARSFPLAHRAWQAGEPFEAVKER